MVLPKADQDLADQADYYAAEGGFRLGARFLNAATVTMSLLAERPKVGWKCKLSHPALASVRVFPVRGFEKILIFYRPMDKRVEVIRVLHGSQDLDLLFDD